MGESVIDADHAGLRLDRFLADRFTYRSRTQWRELISAGRVMLNDRPVRPARLVRQGDRIRYVPLERTEPDIDRDIAFLYQDEGVLAVAKSGNLPVHPAGVAQW